MLIIKPNINVYNVKLIFVLYVEKLIMEKINK